MKNFRPFALLFLLTSAAHSVVMAQDGKQTIQDPQELRILQTARQMAVMAGGARFCKLDSDDIEEFIGKADARLVLLARDDYQKILGRLEFKNILAASSARAPVEGCDQLAKTFNTMLRESR